MSHNLCIKQIYLTFFAKLTVTSIKEDKIIGRNYFGAKQTISISSIQKAYKNDVRGIKSIVIFGSGFWNSIYISVFTYKLQEIIEILNEKGISIIE